MSQKQSKIRIVEVGLRDGLQNESVEVSVETRFELLNRLVKAGITSLEAGSFVSPKWVPAMAPSEELLRLALQNQNNNLISDQVYFSALVPNEKGMEIALRLGIREIAVFAACSESFAQKNTNCSIAESFSRLQKVTELAQRHGIRIRGYLSTCFGCPFEGPVDLNKVSENVQRMLDLGAHEISLGDTIGLASAGHVEKLLSVLLKRFPPHLLAGHFHDTRGQATANVLMAWQMGLTVFDASIGGLGGCPYAPGANGNVATEDIVYLFNSLGVDCGVDLEQLLEINRWLSQTMQRTLPSKVGLAVGRSRLKQGACFL